MCHNLPQASCSFSAEGAGSNRANTSNYLGTPRSRHAGEANGKMPCPADSRETLFFHFLDYVNEAALPIAIFVHFLENSS